MAIDFPESSKYDSDEEEMQKQITRCKDFIELFSEMKELSIFEVDTKGLLQPSFGQGVDLFGYTQQDIDGGLSVLDLFIPEERKKIFQRLKVILSDVKQPDREYHGLKKDGSVFPVLIYSKPVLKGKEVIGRRGIALDITELKKIEQKLKESQEHYQRLIELSPDGIVLTTLDGRVVMANKKALQLYGVAVESDIMGKYIFDFFLSEEPQNVKNKIQKLLDEEIISNYEQSVQRIDGSTFSAEISAGIVYDGDHSPKFFISITRDISQRKITEIRLQMSEEKYRTLMKNLNVAVYRAHMYGYLNAIIVETNPAFLEMFGYPSLTELLQTGREALFATHEARVRFNDAMIKNKKLTNFEISLKKKDGSIFIGSVSGVIIEVKGEEYKIWDGIIEDVTESKQVQKQIIQTNKELESKNDEMEQLSFTLSHDLKAPITSINGFIELIKEETSDNLPENVNFYLDRISSNVIHMSSIIDKILEHSRLGKFVEEIKQYSISEIINGVVMNFIPHLQSENVKIEVEEDLPYVFVEKTRLIQVFENLIDNAIKYMGEKENKLIKIGKKKIQGEFVTLFVEDNGTGIEKEFLPSLFQLFTRIPSNTSSVTGSGVGLANVKKIIETHGGSIWVESEFGKGTTFFFEVPLSENIISE